LEQPPVEPDLFDPWKRNVWLYGLRTPFSLVFLGWITFAQALSPSFNVTIYLLTLLASFLGLVVGAHYIDIASSVEKFSPFFRIPRGKMLAVGVASVLAGAAVGVYISLRWNALFLLFVAVETFAALAYPSEKPKAAHSYAGFGLAWGTVPFLASYFIQAGTVSFTVLGASVFVGFSVVMMHHLAIMSRDSSDWKNALYLLRLYRLSVYSIAALSLAGRLLLA
jgi:MFS family permease